METRDAIRLCCGGYSRHWPTEARTRRVFCVTFWMEDDIVALLVTGLGKVEFINCYRSSARNWEGQAIIVIMLRRQQNSVCVLHILACTMIQKSWRGITALFLVAPNPGFSIQNGELCCHQPYTNTTSSPLSLTKHMSHTNGGFAYTGLVINFNWLIYYDISSVRDDWAGPKHTL